MKTYIGYALIGIAILLAFGIVGGIETDVLTFGQGCIGVGVIAAIATVGRVLVGDEDV